MFCNQCGTENAADTKFCVNCGSSLGTNEAENTKPQIKLNSSKKKWLVPLAVVILVAIALINIVKVELGAVNVKSTNEVLIANNSAPIVETNAYIYCADYDGLYRVDKKTRKADRLDKSHYLPRAATSNTVYLEEDGYELHKISDRDDDVEELFEFGGYGDGYYFSGKYNYCYDAEGRLFKSFNNDDYENVVIFEGFYETDEYVYVARYYKDHVYMLLTKDGFNNDNISRLVRISLKSGRMQELTDEEVVMFAFYDDKIMCALYDGSFMTMELNGKKQELYENIEADDAHEQTLFCYDGYAYYGDYDGIWRFKLNDYDAEAECIIEDHSFVCPIKSGLACIDMEDIVIFDFSGHEIARIKLK